MQPASSVPQLDHAADIRTTSMGPEPSDEDIRLKAYHKYLARGGAHGRDFDDWVEAEQELRRSRRR
jgi:hypothetical protein